MNSAVARSSEPSSSDSGDSSERTSATVASVTSRHSDPSDDSEAEAEGAVFPDAAIGALLGVSVCVPIWVALVAIALRNGGTALGSPLAMAAGIGVLGGVFLGGWAGTLVGASNLDDFERAARSKAPRREP